MLLPGSEVASTGRPFQPVLSFQERSARSGGISARQAENAVYRRVAVEGLSEPVSAVYREFTANLRVLEYDERSKKVSLIIKFS
ncbi:hypothetical protein BQ8794_50280 [Mesorhizobium prunaredense]|uniref:Uncharacterized protein n=1 Tax=Mesorhizobium prunaredense TaxID=1631249 RepID=A0A1R3VE61_9HYPH|nr:hypothetical protein BQ8794_50280 [Mesorhizobium prunaredense]